MSVGVEKVQVVALILQAVMKEESKYEFTIRTDEEIVKRAFKIYDMIELGLYRRQTEYYTGD